MLGEGIITRGAQARILIIGFAFRSFWHEMMSRGKKREIKSNLCKVLVAVEKREARNDLFNQVGKGKPMTMTMKKSVVKE